MEFHALILVGALFDRLCPDFFTAEGTEEIHAENRRVNACILENLLRSLRVFSRRSQRPHLSHPSFEGTQMLRSLILLKHYTVPEA